MTDLVPLWVLPYWSISSPLKITSTHNFLFVYFFLNGEKCTSLQEKCQEKKLNQMFLKSLREWAPLVMWSNQRLCETILSINGNTDNMLQQLHKYTICTILQNHFLFKQCVSWRSSEMGRIFRQTAFWERLVAFFLSMQNVRVENWWKIMEIMENYKIQLCSYIDPAVT